MPIRAICTVFVGLALVAGSGCGSDGADPEEDQAAARQAIEALEELLRDDGFETAPPDDDDDDDDLDFESEECQQFAAAFPEDDEELPGETASEDADFERGEVQDESPTQETVNASVGLVEDEEELAELFELFGDKQLVGCLDEAVQAEFAQQSEDGAVELRDLSVEEEDIGEIGDDTVAFGIDAVLTAGPQRFPITIDFGLARSGRVGALVAVSAVGTGTDPPDIDELLGLLIDEATA